MVTNFQKLVFELKTNHINSKLNASFVKNNDLQFSENLNEINFRKRTDIINHAYNHTLFYKTKYQKFGITPGDIKTENDFCRLPVVSRYDIKNNFSEFIADNVNKNHYYKATTGGSTGTPISVLHDKRFSLTYIQWRVLEWWGIKPYENSAYIYRLRRTGIDKILNTILWWPTKRIFLDASAMDQLTMLSFIKTFNKIKPVLLQGYVGAVYEFALFIRDNSIKIQSPKAVWVTSAPLTEQQRIIMQEIFKAPVYDQYGTCEIMWLAAECKEQTGLHMMSDTRFIEFVDENNMPVEPNNWGRILLTDLHNYAFPLIRYEIGDIGRSFDKQCECGVKLPLMDKVKGRTSDVIKTPSGSIVSGEYLTTIFDDHPHAVREFQIFQEKDFSIKLSYIPENIETIDRIITSVVNGLREKTNNEISIIPIRVNKISHSKGKTQFIISELNQN